MKRVAVAQGALAVVVLGSLVNAALSATIGPDGYGYLATDETPYAFEEISATGTNLNLSDDSSYYGIPFHFDFYGTPYDQVAVGSNGTVYFEDAYLGLARTPIPSINKYNVDRFIAVFWEDLDPGTGGGVYWQVRGSDESERLIVEWKDVPRFGGEGAGTFQAVLYRQSGDVFVYYADTIFGNPEYDSGANVTAGIQGDPSIALEWSFHQAVLTDGLALRYHAVPEPGTASMTSLAAMVGYVLLAHGGRIAPTGEGD